MVVALVILTIVLFCLIEWLTRHQEEHQPVGYKEHIVAKWPPQLAEPQRVAGFQVQPEMAYHPGHAWAFMEGPARARVGMDDFAHRLMGKIDRIDLPKPGDRIRQGEAAWTIHHGGRSVPMLAPVSGEVIEVNEKALKDAASLAGAPYANGWLLRVRSDAPRANLNNLLKGEFAAKWMETLMASLRGRLSPGLAVSFPDGGTAVDDIGALIPDEQWKNVVKEFFLTEV